MSDDGTVDRDRRQLRREAHRRRPRRRHPADPRHRRSARCRPASKAYYNGSLEISETYNRITLANQRTFTPPIFLITLLARLPVVPLVAQDAADDRRGRRQRALDARPVLADGLQLQRPRQHARAARSSCSRSPTTCTSCSTGTRSGAHKSARGRVQGDGRAPGDAALRRQRDDGARHGVARHQPRRRRPLVRHRIGGRRSWSTSPSRWCFVPTLLSLVKPETAAPPHETVPDRADAAGRGVFDAAPARGPRGRGRCCRWSRSLGICDLHVDTNHINFFSPDHPLAQSARRDRPASSRASTASRSCWRGRPSRCSTPDALQRMDRLENELRQAAERARRSIGRRLRASG